MLSPAWDPDFARHEIHGARAQKQILWAAMQYHRGRRVAVDVGAHVGTFTAALLQHYDKVWAFEPVEENFDCLRANVACDRASLENVALGDKIGKQGIAPHNNANSGCWTLAPGDDIVVVTLDYYEITGLDLLKIDVEGTEGLVVRGAMETLAFNRPVVIFEDNGLGQKLLKKAWVDPKPLLAGLGYRRVARVNKDEIWC